ncbi:hypothetical protein JB92DRAFT_3099999 [Gautieria morchelliformis]|nr:hypothetical protein JB92DRAFT_3099999 [Gautieria morchelliformis]
MNVSFLQNEPLNTVIVDSSTGQALYEVDTPWRAGTRTTTVRRPKPGVAPGQGQIIAEIHWRTLGSSTITLYGTTMRIKDWLKKTGVLSSSRTLVAPDGKSYVWSRGSGKFTLTDVGTDTQAAQSHRSKSGWFGGSSRKMNIDISTQAINFQDIVVISFIIMEQKDRRATETAATVAVVSSANTAAASAADDFHSLEILNSVLSSFETSARKAKLSSAYSQHLASPTSSQAPGNARHPIMNVSFLRNEPLNAVIVDSSSGQHLYEVKTSSWTAGTRTTTVRRLKPGLDSDEEQIIAAEIHWRALASSTITLYGDTMRIKDWLTKTSALSPSRKLVAPDGKSYVWSRSPGKSTLTDVDTNTQVAQSHRSKSGWFGASEARKMNIDISSQAMDFQDIVVISFIIMEVRARAG